MKKKASKTIVVIGEDRNHEPRGTPTLLESVKLDGLTEVCYIAYNPERCFCANSKDETMDVKVPTAGFLLLPMQLMYAAS